MSMGGMNAWQWAEAYRDEVEGVMPVVTLPIRVPGRNLIWRLLAINYITDDPAWLSGIMQDLSVAGSNRINSFA